VALARVTIPICPEPTMQLPSLPSIVKRGKPLRFTENNDPGEGFNPSPGYE